MRRLLALLLLAAAFYLIGLSTDPPGQLPDYLRSDPRLDVVLEGGWSTVLVLVAYPWQSAIVLGLMFAPWLIAQLLSVLPRRACRDTVRLFSVDQKRAAVTLCENRCEGEWLPFVRCHGGAEQGDHWFPWSLGGATTMANLVMLCASHNRAKSNKVPTVWETGRLVLRRRRYFPAGSRCEPGEKYRGAGVPAARR